MQFTPIYPNNNNSNNITDCSYKYINFAVPFILDPHGYSSNDKSVKEIKGLCFRANKQHHISSSSHFFLLISTPMSSWIAGNMSSHPKRFEQAIQTVGSVAAWVNSLETRRLGNNTWSPGYHSCAGLYPALKLFSPLFICLPYASPHLSAPGFRAIGYTRRNIYSLLSQL